MEGEKIIVLFLKKEAGGLLQWQCSDISATGQTEDTRGRSLGRSSNITHLDRKGRDPATNIAHQHIAHQHIAHQNIAHQHIAHQHIAQNMTCTIELTKNIAQHVGKYLKFSPEKLLLGEKQHFTKYYQSYAILLLYIVAF